MARLVLIRATCIVFTVQYAALALKARDFDLKPRFDPFRNKTLVEAPHFATDLSFLRQFLALFDPCLHNV